jgi:hypothetical protein
MKIFDKLNLNIETKTYLSGIIFGLIGLFIICAVIFLFILATKLDIVMTTPADETYTYFIAMVDRVLALITLCGILPLTLYQLFSKGKNKTDMMISVVGIVILLAMVTAFFGGEIYFYNKYKNGELNNAKIFNTQTVEMQIFDKIKN